MGCGDGRHVLAFNVICHGDPSNVRTAIPEIARVLKPGGIYQGTMLLKRKANLGIGTEGAADTWIRDGDDDKDHPHFCCSAGELVTLFDRFELSYLEDKMRQKPGSWHCA
ncbi:hypothetical protein [Roseibium sp. LAB1]